MKKRLTNILIFLLFMIGVAVMSYPFASNWYNQRSQTEAIQSYDDLVKQLEAEELEAERDAARAYNEDLLDNVTLTDPFDADEIKNIDVAYESSLNINADGLMGYIEIPVINVNLPVYHGTSSEILEKGVGHLEHTSLPVGGSATHAVLSSHTGLPTAKLFTDLIELKEGDLFYLIILDEILAYEVDKIKVVEPDDTSDLEIDREKDYVTLVTCTPYGVNSHRLLIRGTRVPYTEEKTEQGKVEKVQRHQWPIISVIAPLVLSTVVIIFVKKRCRRKNPEV